MDNFALIDALDKTMVDMYMSFGRLDGSKLVEEEDCTWFTSRIGFGVYSGAIRVNFEPLDASRRIKEVEDMLQASGRPHHWFISPKARPHNISDLLQAAGATKHVELNGMATGLDDIAPPPELPDGIEIRRADDAKSVKHYAELYPRLFGAPPGEWMDDAVTAELEFFRAGDMNVQRYVAYSGDQHIAAGMVVVDGEAATLQSLYTVPEFRGRGIGQALATRGFVRERENGCDLGLIWAGPGADRLYARMGFKYVCKADILAF